MYSFVEFGIGLDRRDSIVPCTCGNLLPSTTDYRHTAKYTEKKRNNSMLSSNLIPMSKMARVKIDNRYGGGPMKFAHPIIISIKSLTPFLLIIAARGSKILFQKDLMIEINCRDPR